MAKSHDNAYQTTKIEFCFETGFEYTDNVFALSSSQQDKYNNKDHEDTLNGRFKYIDSIYDFLFQSSLGFRFNAKTSHHGDTEVAVLLCYNHYFMNPKCSFPEGSVKFEQGLLRTGSIGLEGNFKYGVFKKNYLYSFNDINANNNITKSERYYTQAIFDEYEASLWYGYTFLKKKKKYILTQLGIRPFIGCRFRLFNPEFTNRDQNIVNCGLEVSLEFISRISIKPSYTYEKLFCPGKSELLLYDENRAGVDINNDGDLDNNAVFYTDIDRSCHRHNFELSIKIKIINMLSFLFECRLRKAIFTTDNRLDFDRYDQEENSLRINEGLKIFLMKNCNMTLMWEYNEEEDIDDGKSFENRLSLSIQHSFK